MASLSRSFSSSSALPSPIDSHGSKLNYKLSQDSFAFENVSICDGPDAVGRVIELNFTRRSGLRVAFQGQHEEWAHSFAGKASLQACLRLGSMLTAESSPVSVFCHHRLWLYRVCSVATDDSITDGWKEGCTTNAQSCNGKMQALRGRKDVVVILVIHNQYEDV